MCLFFCNSVIALCQAEMLGARLEVEGKGTLSLNAQLCYICAGNLNKLIECWTVTEKTDTPTKLQQLVELVMLLIKAVEQQGRTVEMSGKLAEVLSHYAAVLASQGNLTAALTYLQNSESVSNLVMIIYCNIKIIDKKLKVFIFTKM
jgi:protein transport protein SEC31